MLKVKLKKMDAVDDVLIDDDNDDDVRWWHKNKTIKIWRYEIFRASSEGGVASDMYLF